MNEDLCCILLTISTFVHSIGKCSGICVNRWETGILNISVVLTDSQTCSSTDCE